MESFNRQLDKAIKDYADQIAWMKKCAGDRVPTRANYVQRYVERGTTVEQAGRIFDADMEYLRRLEEIVNTKKAKLEASAARRERRVEALAHYRSERAMMRGY